MRKYLFITLPSMGKTTLCNSIASKLNGKQNDFRKQKVIIDFDLHYMRFVLDNKSNIVDIQTEYLKQLLLSENVIGVTGFINQFNFKRIFTDLDFASKVDLQICIIIPTLRRLGQAIYDNFNRSSYKYTRLFGGDDELELISYPWCSIASMEIVQKHYLELFGFQYFIEGSVWLKDFIKDVKDLVNIYLDQTQDYKYFYHLSIFSIDVGRFVSDVYQILIKKLGANQSNGINQIKTKDFPGINDECLYHYIDDNEKREKQVMLDKIFNGEHQTAIKFATQSFLNKYQYLVPEAVNEYHILLDYLNHPNDYEYDAPFRHYMLPRHLLFKYHPELFNDDDSDAMSEIKSLNDR